MTNDCKTCPVSTGTHKPAEAVHQIDEPQADALRLAAWLLHRGMSGIKQNDIEASNQLRWLHAESLQHKQELAAYRFTVENREARIAELEGQLEAIGAGGVEPLRKPAAAPQAVQHVPWCPDVCPITGRKFFMWIEHWATGKDVPTYGGPYDSYTIPVKEQDGTFTCERYDHDAGEWMTEGMGWECVGVMLVDDQSFVVDPKNPRYMEIEEFATQPAAQGMEALPMQASEGVEDVAVMEHPEWMLVHKETGAQKPLDSQWTVRAAQPAAQGAATTGYIAPKGRYVPPVLFSPYTGEPRDARDIASDPRGILIVPPGAALAAQAKQGGAE